MLDTITRNKKSAFAFTICGESGMGKTTLASTMPNPVFIKAEDGTGILEVDSFPLIKNSDELWGQLNALIKGKHDYKTVVIDSITVLDELFIQELVEKDKDKDKNGSPKTINTILGGYGAGYIALAAMHGRVRKAAQLLLERGINVVFIAHTKTTFLELPDQDPYHTYVLKLSEKSMVHYVDNVDLVGFIKLETYTFGNDDKKPKKARSDGTRVLVTYATPSNISKNRFGISEDITLVKGENPFKEILN